jgi:hypothetical protein
MGQMPAGHYQLIAVTDPLLTGDSSLGRQERAAFAGGPFCTLDGVCICMGRTRRIRLQLRDGMTHAGDVIDSDASRSRLISVLRSHLSDEPLLDGPGS